MKDKKRTGNVVLTGFMGTGKSVVGMRLAKELGLKFLDLDEAIEREAGSGIKDIFRTKGEAYFRDIESNVILKLAAGEYGHGIVAAAGGGAVVRPANRKALNGWGAVICLGASVDEILKRTGDGDERPLLDTHDRDDRDGRRKKIEVLLREREDAYRECDFFLDTTGVSVEEVAENIKSFLENLT